MTAYPVGARFRDAFILARRPARAPHDPWQAHGVTVEQEPDAEGDLADVVTVFLTGRECPWHCAMCDLWKFATAEDTPPGAIPRQIREALGSLGRASRAGRASGAGGARPRHLKLYNAGSFFDPRAVPPSDYRAVAAAASGFSRVIVESHPALIGVRVDEFLHALAAEAVDRSPRLEVAMGLETAHPDALERLNKRMTLEQFRHAAGEVRRRNVALRVFVLVSPPFVPDHEQAQWLRRSVDAAFECGATAVSLIPMRDGNGTVEALADQRLHQSPTLQLVEDAFDATRQRAAGRVFLDLWDLERLASCDACFERRRARLHQMNLAQRRIPRVSCPACSPVEARA